MAAFAPSRNRLWPHRNLKNKRRSAGNNYRPTADFEKALMIRAFIFFSWRHGPLTPLSSLTQLTQQPKVGKRIQSEAGNPADQLTQLSETKEKTAFPCSQQLARASNHRRPYDYRMTRFPWKNGSKTTPQKPVFHVRLERVTRPLRPCDLDTKVGRFFSFAADIPLYKCNDSKKWG